MEDFISLKQVAEYLNKKFSSIRNFNVLSINQDEVLSGGFYWINAPWALPSKYAFYETYEKKSDYHSLVDLAKAAEERILNQIRKQKEFDESYAKEFSKPIKYTYNYNILKNVE